jgi:hypothetical protein
MKKALISPLEQREVGVRVAQIEVESFEVAEPLFWVDCSDDITTEYTYLDGEFIAPPEPEPAEEVQGETT